ncbi:hypothetical protein K435DRAFT_355239 [Dendrothele bispora CBS 962.96]|uniref:Branched-chain alpha-ketoacid dehydrogenase kinase/Pyruvate dehydrogenase kinase N-terminal domain-containing protein n=1 Tax=Dendrothele bispora (strain CBS 962.96) TaxID=1314807 RepID=A0A4S8LDX3_DENBC|nr:hypothetical protein K435DRAFT_355239 [Dendrothele bispora CBS 962.96]
MIFRRWQRASKKAHATSPSPDQINVFLDGAIRNRILVRLIAEQHIALPSAFPNCPPHFLILSCIDLFFLDVLGRRYSINPYLPLSQMVRTSGSFVSELYGATLGASSRIVTDGHPRVYVYICSSALGVHAYGNFEEFV